MKHRLTTYTICFILLMNGCNSNLTSEEFLTQTSLQENPLNANCVVNEKYYPNYIFFVRPEPGTAMKIQDYKIEYNKENGIMVKIDPRPIINCPVKTDDQQIFINKLLIDGVSTSFFELFDGLVNELYVDENGKQCIIDVGPFWYWWDIKLLPGKHQARLELSTNKYQNLIFEWCFEIYE